MLKLLKDWMLPIAMGCGALFYPLFGQLAVLTPLLIFSMLLVTFSKVSFDQLKIEWLHVWLLLIQLGGGLCAYALLCSYNIVVAESALICLLAPTATSAAVITGMLGGDILFLTSYTLFSSLAVAIGAPLIFSLLGTHNDLPFIESFIYICRQVAPLLLFPLIAAWLIRKYAKPVQKKIASIRQLGFYIWALALAIVTGKTVQFLINQKNPNYVEQLTIAGVALIICIAQFAMGRMLGKRYGDTISAQQGLGQKNTILAIWMAQVYLSPISSIGPAAYVLWQNGVNSYQLWRARKN
jgi:BASS family bile acid:Na+ symporter